MDNNNTDCCCREDQLANALATCAIIWICWKWMEMVDRLVDRCD